MEMLQKQDSLGRSVKYCFLYILKNAKNKQKHAIYKELTMNAKKGFSTFFIIFLI